MNIISSTVYQAAQALTVVEAAHGTSTFGLAVNRRRVEGGTVYREPFADGPVEDRISTLTFSANGRVLGGVVHAAMHPVVLGAESTAISADWCGQMVRDISASVGGCWVFLNGCAGDNNPLVWSGRSYEEMVRVGTEAATRAREAIQTAVPISIETLWGRNRSASFESQQHPYLSREQSRRMKNDGGLFLEVQSIQIGPLQFVGIGGECLYNPGNELKSEKESRLIVSYANDYFGYLPAPFQYDEGGYEPAASMLSREGAASYLEFVQNFLDG